MKTWRLFLSLGAWFSLATTPVWADGSDLTEKKTGLQKTEKSKSKALQQARIRTDHVSPAYKTAMSWKNRRGHLPLLKAFWFCAATYIRDACDRLSMRSCDVLVSQVSNGDFYQLHLMVKQDYGCDEQRARIYLPPRRKPKTESPTESHWDEPRPKPNT